MLSKLNRGNEPRPGITINGDVLDIDIIPILRTPQLHQNKSSRTGQVSAHLVIRRTESLHGWVKFEAHDVTLPLNEEAGMGLKSIAGQLVALLWCRDGLDLARTGPQTTVPAGRAIRVLVLGRWPLIAQVSPPLTV
jgi:hypothetical protein